MDEAKQALLSLLIGSAGPAMAAARQATQGKSGLDKDKAAALINLCRGNLTELDQLLDRLQTDGIDTSAVRQARPLLAKRLSAVDPLIDTAWGDDAKAAATALQQIVTLCTPLHADLVAALAAARKLRRDRQKKAVQDGIADPTLDADLRTLLDRLDKINARLEALAFPGDQTTSNEADMLAALKRASAIADPAARAKALAALRKRLQEGIDHQQALLDLATKAGDGAKGKPLDEDARSKVYKKALEAQYGIDIKLPRFGLQLPFMDRTQTHFDRVYDMLGSVPKEQANNPKFKKLVYTDEAGGGAAYGEATIELGDMGDASSSTPYQVGGKSVQANWMDVAMLHELGHSLDDDKGIMKGLMTDEGCGGWKPETLESVAAALWAALAPRVSDEGKKLGVRDLLVNALKTGQAPGKDAAAKFGNQDWLAINTFIADACLPILQANDPWFQAQPPFVNAGRAYHQAYAGEWWSYSMAARGSTFVRDYQWRSPWEWFAEVYAISWYAKAKPPGAVSPKLAPYLWKE